jgi:hypothetical protein
MGENRLLDVILVTQVESVLTVEGKKTRLERLGLYQRVPGIVIKTIG